MLAPDITSQNQEAVWGEMMNSVLSALSLRGRKDIEWDYPAGQLDTRGLSGKQDGLQGSGRKRSLKTEMVWSGK